MKSVIIFICSVVLPIFSLKLSKPNLCINCKHFISDTVGNEYGRCGLFPYNGNTRTLVTGIDDYKNYYYCSVTRYYEDMCGREGKHYEIKVQKKKKE